MKTLIFVSTIMIAFVSSSAFAQMTGGYGGGMQQGQPAAQNGDRNQQTATTTKTKTSTSMSAKDYLDNQIASSKDKKFHLPFNGKDVPLTPVKFHEEKKLGGGKSSTAVDMKGSDGKLYEVIFLSSGGQPTGAKIHPLTATH
jgi:hypothetical protein